MSNGNGQDDTPDEIIRVSHVYRVYQNDDTSSTVWLDIERLDELHFLHHGSQRDHWVLAWDQFDDTSADKKKIYKPSDDPSAAQTDVDPNVYIEVSIRNSIWIVTTKRRYRFKFINDNTNKRRKTLSHRVYHHDIPPNYMDGTNPPKKPDDYMNALGDQDVGQYIDVERLNAHWNKGGEQYDQNLHRRHRRGHDVQNQQKKWQYKTDKLLRDPLLKGDAADPKFTPTHNPADGPIVDPPWRLDPLQHIVNVNWGGIAVIFGPQSSDAPDQQKKDPKVS